MAGLKFPGHVLSLKRSATTTTFLPTAAENNSRSSTPAQEDREKWLIDFSDEDDLDLPPLPHLVYRSNIPAPAVPPTVQLDRILDEHAGLVRERSQKQVSAVEGLPSTSVVPSNTMKSEIMTEGCCQKRQQLFREHTLHSTSPIYKHERDTSYNEGWGSEERKEYCESDKEEGEPMKVEESTKFLEEIHLSHNTADRWKYCSGMKSTLRVKNASPPSTAKSMSRHLPKKNPNTSNRRG